MTVHSEDVEGNRFFPALAGVYDHKKARCLSNRALVKSIEINPDMFSDVSLQFPYGILIHFSG